MTHKESTQRVTASPCARHFSGFSSPRLHCKKARFCSPHLAEICLEAVISTADVARGGDAADSPAMVIAVCSSTQIRRITRQLNPTPRRQHEIQGFDVSVVTMPAVPEPLRMGSEGKLRCTRIIVLRSNEVQGSRRHSIPYLERKRCRRREESSDFSGPSAPAVQVSERAVQCTGRVRYGGCELW